VRFREIARLAGPLVLTLSLGVSLTDTASATNALHKWAIEKISTPRSGHSAFLSGVSCSSRTKCVAVGEYVVDRHRGFVALAEVRTGSGWKHIAPVIPADAPARADVTSELEAVACTSASHCVAVGTYLRVFSQTATTINEHDVPLIEVWNGRQWTVQNAPLPRALVTAGSNLDGIGLRGVSCSSVSACSAVGTYSRGERDRTFALVYSRGLWKRQATPDAPGASSPDSRLMGVSCPSPNACTAVGFHTTHSGRQAPLVLQHRQGVWRASRVPVPQNAATGANNSGDGLSSVSCVTRRYCEAVGTYSTSSDTRGLIETWNGHAWKIQRLSQPSSGDVNVLAVSCAARLSCISVGQRSGEPASLIERWNGRKWVLEKNSGVGNRFFFGISCFSPRSCVGVGVNNAEKMFAAKA
jgi:hypothetical protein